MAKPACSDATKSEGQVRGSSYLEATWISILEPKQEKTGFGMRHLWAAVPVLPVFLPPCWARRALESLWPAMAVPGSSGRWATLLASGKGSKPQTAADCQGSAEEGEGGGEEREEGEQWEERIRARPRPQNTK